jgi:uncharacterized protein (TIGR00255 family)
MAKTRGAQRMPVMSMTGFGVGSSKTKAARLDVEIRSVNARYLDATVKLPRLYSAFESDIREKLSNAVERGRVEVTVTRNAIGNQAARIRFDAQLFDALLSRYEMAWKRAGLSKNDDRDEMLVAILGRREVLDIVDDQEDALAERKALIQAVGKALTSLKDMRQIEGQRLGADIAARLAAIEKIRRLLAQERVRAVQLIEVKLKARLAKLLGEFELDSQRLAMEVAVLADRSDVHEELVRIESHLKQAQLALGESRSGRKLEFLVQEFGREFNTIASKAQDARIQQLVVEAKGELEKIREQVQNLE